MINDTEHKFFILFLRVLVKFWANYFAVVTAWSGY